MQFDQFGNLAPYEVQTIDLNTFEAFFVVAFAQSESRRRLFDNYLKYVQELQSFAPTGFYQWIDGSFITNKLNPRDIDFVTFLDWQDYRKNDTAISELRKRRFDKSSGMDGYFVEVFPALHKDFSNFQITRVEWLHLFATSRTSKSKGIIQLNF